MKLRHLLRTAWSCCHGLGIRLVQRRALWRPLLFFIGSHVAHRFVTRLPRSTYTACLCVWASLRI